MLIIPLVLGPIETNCYIVAAGEESPGAVIDPADNAPAIVQAARESRIEIQRILVTHGHFDHILGLAELKRLTGAPVLIHPADAQCLASAVSCGADLFGLAYEPCRADGDLAEGETIRIGELELEVLHTPGHTSGGVSFFAKARGSRRPVVFCGDTLFRGSIGRTDVPGASPETLLRSIRQKLMALPEGTRVLPGHGAETTIGREARHNPFLAGPTG